MEKTIAELMAEDGLKNGPFNVAWQLSWAAEKIAQLTAKDCNCSDDGACAKCTRSCSHKSAVEIDE